MFHFPKSSYNKFRLPTSRRAIYRCLLAVLLAILSGSSSEAQQIKDRKTAIGRPVPEPMKVQVVKGQTVRITLSSTTKTKATLVEYLIRDFPTLGIAGQLRTTPEDRTKATIIYQAARQSKGSVDMFSFSARYSGGYYSAPAQVIIELSEPAPRIEAPSSIDFGKLILGDEVTREVLLKNSGNIEYRKHIQLPAPLELIEPVDGKLSIPPDSEALVKIRYRPEKVGVHKMNYAFQDKPGITFIGSAFAPFITSDKNLTLEWNDKEQNRECEIQVTNQAKKPLSIKIRTPIRAQYLSNRPLLLPPGKSESVRIVLPKEDVQSFKGTLEIATEQYSQKIPLESQATPPRIQIELPDPNLNHMDFGEANPGETISRTFMIKNFGGTASIIGMGARPPFRIAINKVGNLPAAFSVGPESSAAFTVNFIAPSTQFGTYSDSLVIGTDVGAYSIGLTGLVRDPNPMSGQTPVHPQIIKDLANAKLNPPTNASLAKDAPLPPPQPLPPLPDLEKGEDHRSPIGFYTRDYVTRDFSDSIPAPSEFNLYKVGRHDMTLSWKIPSPDHTVFEIDMRQMLLNPVNYGIESVWVPFHNVDFKRSKGIVYANIKGLDPSSIYEFRVLSTGNGGKFSFPSKAFGARTMPPYDYTWVKRLLLILGLSTVVLLVRRYWIKHEGSFPMPTYWPRGITWPFE